LIEEGESEPGALLGRPSEPPAIARASVSASFTFTGGFVVLVTLGAAGRFELGPGPLGGLFMRGGSKDAEKAPSL
jgi:hypothetical protein